MVMTDCEPEQEVRDLFQGDLIVSATSLRAPENSSHMDFLDRWQKR
jgi:hypothetical protein